jgi:hypothetical protein
LADRLAKLFSARDIYFDSDHDADRRRIASELNAIRVRFREHA